MANFRLEVHDTHVNIMFTGIILPPLRVPRHMQVQLQILQVEDIILGKVYTGIRWHAVLYARHIDPPLVLQIKGPEPGLKELGEGLRLRAFLAQIAMEGKSEELIDQLLSDIWFERDFASNSNAEIVEDGEA